jgi:predicted component of type VI protein secretion system
MAKESSQKFVARNRAPRVQIEYDLEVYGAEKKINLPFVMGVMADLSGKPAEALPAVADRKLLEVDEAAGGVQRAQHAERAGTTAGGDHLRKHG